MSIKKVGEFYKDEGNENIERIPSIGIDSSNLEACVQEIISTNSDAIFGHPTYGFKEHNLDFLLKLPEIKKISFWDIELNDIDALYTLNNLEDFYIESKRPGVNFTKLPLLKSLIVEYHKDDIGIDTLQYVKLLHLWEFKPEGKSFDILVLPPNISELKIIQANPSNLRGITRCKSLKDLELSYFHNLTTLDGLDEFAPNLEKLVIDNCPNLKDIIVIKKLSNIQYISINGEILTRDISLPFARDKEKNLKQISFEYFLFEDDYDKSDPLNGTIGDIAIQAGNKKILDIEGVELLKFAKALTNWLEQGKKTAQSFNFVFNNKEYLSFNYISEKDYYRVEGETKKEFSKEALFNAIAIYIDDLHKEIIERFDFDFLPELTTEIEIDI